MSDLDFNFKYDRTLKDILKAVPKKFVEILTGRKALDFLDTNFPKVEELKADLLVKLEDGGIFHLELQTSNDPKLTLKKKAEKRGQIYLLNIKYFLHRHFR